MSAPAALHARPVILAWQLGGGRGHVSALKQIALALGTGVPMEAALRSMDHAADFAGLCAHAYPCAALGYRAGQVMPAKATSSWGQYLGDVGFADVTLLTRCFAWWHRVFEVRKPALVVCDYAPVAQWAARSMGIPVVTVGTAFGQPPASLQTFPLLLPEHDGQPHDEGELVANVNAATQPLGFAPLTRLAELYAVDRQLLMSFPMLDPYGDAPGRTHFSPVPTLDAGCRSAGRGDDVFVYFSTSETRNGPLVDAIATLGLPVTAYMPGGDPDAIARLAAAGVKLRDAPATPAEIKAGSRLMLHAGQHGILSLGLALGLPQFAVPQQLEQLFHARKAASGGSLAMPVRTGVDADAFRSAIRDAYHGAAMADAARQVQERITADLPNDALAELRNGLMPFLS